MRHALPAVLLSAVLAGCGTSSSPGGASTGSTSPTTATSSAASPVPLGPQAKASCAPAPTVLHSVPGTTDLARKPQIAAPRAPAPCNLVIGDIVRGTGAVALPGKQITVKYVGVLYSTGKQFDASWDRGQDFPFGLGAGSVIPGWDQGLVGMRVGGRRQLVIPPALAYGDQGSPPVIPPQATLIFVVDLVKVS